MANYVKFQRGSQEAYDALKAAGTLDNNTLYFICNRTKREIFEKSIKIFYIKEKTHPCGWA